MYTHPPKHKKTHKQDLKQKFYFKIFFQVYNFAIRSTLLSTEVLKHIGDFSDAAMMMIKLTSEDSDLLSALMLEQAAHCFINHHHPMPRKYAFHMTLAGHRFSKAGQKFHSFRSYQQAFQVSGVDG